MQFVPHARLATPVPKVHRDLLRLDNLIPPIQNAFVARGVGGYGMAVRRDGNDIGARPRRARLAVSVVLGR